MGFNHDNGIALEVPTTRVGFSPALKAEIDTSTEAAIDLSGIDYVTGGLDQLLDIRQPLRESAGLGR